MEQDLVFRNKLQELLILKKSKNPKYSQRALARDLGLDSAYLVHILKGKKRVTPQVAFKIGQFMGLKGEEFINFIEPTFH